MPVKDMRSGMLPISAFSANISSDTTTNGAIIDTKDMDRGLTFFFQALNYTDGTYTPVIEESEDSGMAGATDLTDNQLIGLESGAVLTAESAQGSNLPSIGVFSVKRYVRVKIVSTSTSSGSDINVLATAGKEVSPSPDLSA